MKGYIKEIQEDFILLMYRQGYEQVDISLLFHIDIYEVESIISECPKHYFPRYVSNYVSKLMKQEPNKEPQTVYFIQQECSDGLIKIGYTSRGVKSRVAALSTGIPYKLTVLKTIEGDLRKEAELHTKFKEDRVNPNREWFYPSNELLEFIDSL